MSIKVRITAIKSLKDVHQVVIDSKKTGVIRKRIIGWVYFPNNDTVGGKPYKTLDACSKAINSLVAAE